VFATVKRSPLHPGADVVEEAIPVTRELRSLARAVGRVFGLDIYGIDVVETADGWVVLDVNDFPSFGNVPEAASRLARTVLRVTRRGYERCEGVAGPMAASIAGYAEGRHELPLLPLQPLADAAPLPAAPPPAV
jgi:hypothetical protein